MGSAGSLCATSRSAVMSTGIDCVEEAGGVHVQIVDDLMQYPLGDGDRYRAIVAAVITSSLGKHADSASDDFA